MAVSHRGRGSQAKEFFVYSLLTVKASMYDFMCLLYYEPILDYIYTRSVF